MLLEVAARQVESADVVSLWLKVVEGRFHPFVAGQHLPLRLGLPGRALATYTIASDPADQRGYRISVKRAPGGKGGSAFLHDQAPIGQRIPAEPPRGRFTLADDDRPVLLLTGGIGITPALAMLPVLARQPTRPVYFVHACRDLADHGFGAEIAAQIAQAPHIRAVTAFAEGGPDDLAQGLCQKIGWIDRAWLRALLPQDAYHAYLCGPEGFLQAMRAALTSLGLAPEAIHQESFGGAPAPNPAPNPVPGPVPGPAKAPMVHFVKSQIRVAWDGSHESLLDLAEAQGLRPDFECRAGLCGSCLCTRISGEVTHSEDLIDSPPAGKIYLCCAIPKADLELDL